MATSPVFDWAGSELQKQTGLQALPARGMLRLALRDGGLDARSLTATEMRAVLDRLLPEQLRRGGVDDPAGVCHRLSVALGSQRFAETSKDSDTAEAFFRRVLRPR